jgi:hypothetical protein
MTSYKDFGKTYIGDSDIAALTIRTVEGVYDLCFGGDNSYYAYVCEGDVEIGEHYKKVFSGDTWIKIYDDQGLTFNRYAGYGKTIDIYRAGEYGCIIHIH